MSAFAAIAYLSAFAEGVFAIAAVVRARRSFAHWPFAAGMAVLAAESVFCGLAATTHSAVDMLRLQQWRLVALFLVPGIWMLFSGTYSRGAPRDHSGRWRAAFAAAFVVPLGVGYFCRDYLIAVVIRDPADTYWVIRLGSTGIILYSYLLVSSVLVLMNLERTYRAAVGTMRWRIKFMLMGVGILFAVRIYTSSQALLYRSINLSVESLNGGAMLVASLLLLASFMRSGDFEVDVYPSQSVLQNSITVLVAGVYLVVVGSLAKVVSFVGGDAAFAIKAFLALVSLVALALILQSDRARLRLNRFVSRHFQRPLYDYRTVWRKFTEGTASRVEPGELCRSIVKMVAEIFQVLSVSIWLLEDNEESLGMTASTFLTDAKGPASGLQRSEVIRVIRYFEENPEPVDIESLEADWAAALRRIHVSEFPNGGRRVCVPLVGQGKLVGLISLGDRVGGVAFTTQDFDILKCVGDHATACLRNVQLSQKLLQAKEFEAFQTMAAFFVHDLKNAASTLNLMLQNLPVHFDDPQFRADSLRGISKTVAHINDLIGRLSLFRHEQSVRLGESDLNPLVASAVEALEKAATQPINVHLGKVPPVMLDREQMQKVVTNLVLNATQALSGEGSVRVETRAEPGWLVLTVSDDGCGMTADFISHGLFRPFQTTKKNGLGIGMFQSKRIIESHGGRIAVASEPGKGTTFQVFLPVANKAK